MTGIALAFRRLRQSPMFTFTAVVSLALGIGANSAMFGLAEALLLRPLPVPAPEQLVQLQSVGKNAEPHPIVGSIVDAVRDAKAFAGICSFLTPLTTVDVNGRLATVSGVAASGDCFQTLGVRAALGRLPGPADDYTGAPKVVAISYQTWRDDFGGQPDVLGQSIGVDGARFTIIGVAERSFPGLLLGFPAHVYLPIHQVSLPGELTYATLGQVTFARLHPRQTATQAESRLKALWTEWMKTSVPSRLNDAERADYLERQPTVTSAEYGRTTGFEADSDDRSGCSSGSDRSCSSWPRSMSATCFSRAGRKAVGISHSVSRWERPGGRSLARCS
jgi:hypothetical protein